MDHIVKCEIICNKIILNITTVKAFHNALETCQCATFSIIKTTPPFPSLKLSII